MGIAADSLFNALMSWVRALVNALWALFSADRTTALEFLGKNWMAIAAVIIICGLAIDWIVWLIRWQPYHIWARKARKLLRLDEPDEEEAPKSKGKAHAAVLPEKRFARPENTEPAEDTPLYLHNLEDEQAWLDHADEIPEEALDAYPGMRYGSAHRENVQDTKAHSPLTQEAPGAAEEARRRAEIDAWQRHFQEEARARAEAEKAEREAEQARLAQEAYEAEQARLAQEEYARQMEEYERQKAQYERDLLEYERQKAEYEAQLAAQQEGQTPAGAARRRRGAPIADASDMEATRVQQIVRAPESTVRRTKPAAKSAAKPAKEKTQEPKADKSSGLLGRMAKMIEPEEEEIISRKTLPPRVDMNDAFRTAKLPVVTPPRNTRRKE